ncbi:hypothetical protein Q9Q99_01925 [Curtobacterium flaccumfaciens]|nr:hypothetical protein Q9Q99_01925 [Curtobacterium flaccumfaciens]
MRRPFAANPTPPRRSGGRVSRKRSTTATKNTAPSTASTTNMSRHVPIVSTAPPASGAITGPIALMAARVPNTFAIRVPLVTSDTIARPATAPAAPASPCATRATTSVTTSGASAQPTDARANRAVPATSIGRRPIPSLTGPTSS